MLKHETTRTYRVQFDSLYEVTRWLETEPESRTWTARSSKTNGASNSWDLGVGYSGALKLARDGWADGVVKLAALAATVPNNVVVTRSYGIAGELPDVPRYLAGDPFNMIHRGKAKTPKPTMTIALNVSANAAVSAQEMWNLGAAVVALIDRLESRRVRVEVLGCWATGSSKRHGFSWTVKRAQDPLDLSAVAFSLAHPAMLRRIGFAVIERSTLPTDHGYGMPTAKLVPEDFVDLPEGALLIGGIGNSMGACKTMAGALAYAKGKINEAYRALGNDSDIAELEELD